MASMSRRQQPITVPPSITWGRNPAGRWRAASSGSTSALTSSLRRIVPTIVRPRGIRCSLMIDMLSSTHILIASGYGSGMGSEYRLDELARSAGVASTTVRLYQTKGLLAPPRLEGRTGWYDDSHLSRLRLIARLQSEGYSLGGIAN